MKRTICLCGSFLFGTHLARTPAISSFESLCSAKENILTRTELMIVFRLRGFSVNMS